MGANVLYLVLTLFNVFVLTCLAYGWGYQRAKSKKFVEIGTTDEIVQDALNRTLTKVGRDDKINVADIERYIAIMHKGEVTFIKLDEL